jgi:phosphohistidine phosphatase
VSSPARAEASPWSLYVLRHAIAAPRDGELPDGERPLTRKGREKLEKVVRGMRRLELAFDEVWTSPLVRARDTAAVVADAFGKPLVETQHLLPGASAQKLVQQIAARRAAGDLILVGHEPFLSRLVAVLVAGETTANVTLRKAGLCKLALTRIEYGRCAALEWLLTPGLLADL